MLIFSSYKFTFPPKCIPRPLTFYCDLLLSFVPIINNSTGPDNQLNKSFQFRMLCKCHFRLHYVPYPTGHFYSLLKVETQ